MDHFEVDVEEGDDYTSPELQPDQALVGPGHHSPFPTWQPPQPWSYPTHFMPFDPNILQNDFDTHGPCQIPGQGVQMYPAGPTRSRHAQKRKRNQKDNGTRKTTREPSPGPDAAQENKEVALADFLVQTHKGLHDRGLLFSSDVHFTIKGDLAKVEFRPILPSAAEASA